MANIWTSPEGAEYVECSESGISTLDFIVPSDVDADGYYAFRHPISGIGAIIRLRPPGGWGGTPVRVIPNPGVPPLPPVPKPGEA